jgi:hypothetical protein
MFLLTVSLIKRDNFVVKKIMYQNYNLGNNNLFIYFVISYITRVVLVYV